MPDPSDTTTGPVGLSRHDLYELCVQSPRHIVPMLRAVHGGSPRTLAEDFAGTAAVSHLWAELDASRHAIATDTDAETLARRPDHPRVTKHATDVMAITDPADIVFVGNFSIGYMHTRKDLLAYLRHARSRISPAGVLICDTYGGDTAFLTGDVHRDHIITEGPHAGKRVRYTWEQRDADPITAMVTDVCHFRVDKAGVIELELDDAFVYRWRLWSVPELIDAMHEAGFTTTEVYDKTPDAMDEDGNVYLLPVEDGSELEDSFIVCVAARL
ncbi:MAG: hypothetical protein AAF235_03475 [Planctomycetota bacterium]